MKIKIAKFPLLILALGILFSLFLLMQVKDETFYSGDGSLKFLIAKQFSSGNFHIDINLPVESWIAQIWREGLYPFGTKEPWVYYRDNRYYSPFPFTFSVVSAPFYALFGFRGLYIIPVVSLWTIWFGFHRICQRLKLDSIVTSLALITLIFASPLTLYGAMYWEHTLAVALAFNGLAILYAPREEELSTKEAILSGILIGLSVWFRGEFLCLIGIMCLLALTTTRINFAFEALLLVSGIALSLFVLLKQDSIGFLGIFILLAYASSRLNIVFRKKKIFVASMLLTLAVYWILNTIIYHHPLGIHALQVVEHMSLRGRLNAAYKYFNSMNSELFYYFPTTCFALIYVLLGLFNRKIRLKPQMKVLLIICILFDFGVPLLLPSEGGKQWGPRFLLLLIPVISLLAIMAWQTSIKLLPLRLRYAVSAIFLMLLTTGVYTNVYQGYQEIVKSNQPNYSLNYLRKDNTKIVATNHEFISQSFIPVINSKTLFLTKTPENFAKLVTALHAQNYNEFIYVCSRYNSCLSAPEIESQLAASPATKSITVKFFKPEDSRYLYKVSILENQPKSNLLS